jgi:hypothetical protein
MRRICNALGRLCRSTIWAPDAIPLDEDKYGSLKRYLLPYIDVVLFFSGYSAVRYGAPSLSEFVPPGVTETFALLFMGATVMAFIGVVFPRLATLEVAAKLTLFALSVAYAVALFLLTQAGSEIRGFITGYVAAVAGLLLWRLAFLGRERRERKAA